MFACSFDDVCLCQPKSAFSEDLKIRTGDSIQSVLVAYKGKRVTLKLMGYEEMSGKVRTVTQELVQLEEMNNEEYLECVVEISKITAVKIRVRE